LVLQKRDEYQFSTQQASALTITNYLNTSEAIRMIFFVFYKKFECYAKKHLYVMSTIY